MARTSPSRDSRSENPTDESQSGSEMEVSLLSEPNVERLRKQYCIPKQFQLFAPGVDGQVNTLPSGQVAFYVKDLRTDLRFSISKFI